MALYEPTAGATIHALASDPRVNHNSLRSWLDTFGAGSRTKANGKKITNPTVAVDFATVALGFSNTEHIRVLELGNAKLREEREILQRAAKYFAEETNW